MGKILGSVFQEDRAAFLNKQVEPLIERYLNPLNEMLSRNNGGEESEKGFLLGDQLTFADLMLTETLDYVQELFPTVLNKNYALFKKVEC